MLKVLFDLKNRRETHTKKKEESNTVKIHNTNAIYHMKLTSLHVVHRMCQIQMRMEIFGNFQQESHSNMFALPQIRNINETRTIFH